MADLTDAQLEQLIKDIGLKRPRGGSERKPIAHGTFKGARQHRYRKEPLCEPCRLAENAYQNERNRALRQTSRDVLAETSEPVSGPS
jgi:hypothetical protein